MAIKNQPIKFPMVFFLPIFGLFLFNSLFFIFLGEYFFLILNFLVLLCIVTFAANAWNRFMDRIQGELKNVAEEADSMAHSAHLLEIELKRLTDIRTGGSELKDINKQMMDLLIYNRQKAEQGGSVGMAHLNMAKELVKTCTQLKTISQDKKEYSETPFVLLDCIQLNNKKIKSHLVNFQKPKEPMPKLNRNGPFVRTAPIYK